MIERPASSTMKPARSCAIVLFLALTAASAFSQGTPGTLFSAPAAPIGAPHGFRIQSGMPGAVYVFDLSATGTTPGFSLGPGSPVIPLNRPFIFIDLLGGVPNPLMVDFVGTTDASGRAAPTLQVPLVPEIVGLGLDGCAVTLGAGPFGIALVTNPAHVVLVGADAGLPSGAAAPFVPPAPP